MLSKALRFTLKLLAGAGSLFFVSPVGASTISPGNVSLHPDAFGLLIAAGVLIFSALAEIVLIRSKSHIDFIIVIVVAALWSLLRLSMPTPAEGIGAYTFLTSILTGALFLYARRLLDLPAQQPGLARLTLTMTFLSVLVWIPALFLKSTVSLFLILLMSAGGLGFISWMALKLGRLFFAEILFFFIGSAVFIFLQISALAGVMIGSFYPSHDWIVLLLALMGLAWRIAITAQLKVMFDEELMAKDQLIFEYQGQVEFQQSTELILNQRLEKRELKINSLKNQLVDYTKRHHHLEKQLVQSEELIRQFSYFDSLTGLPNRALFSNQLEQLIEHAENAKPKQLLLLGMIDIDHFGVVNAEQGPELADELLSQVAKRLQSILPINTLIARLGGDEFAFVLQDIGSAELARGLIQRWLSELSLPFRVNEKTSIELCFTFGMAVYPDDGVTASKMMQCVESHVTTSKESRSDLKLFQTAKMGQGK